MFYAVIKILNTQVYAVVNFLFQAIFGFSFAVGYGNVC